MRHLCFLGWRSRFDECVSAKRLRPIGSVVEAEPTVEEIFSSSAGYGLQHPRWAVGSARDPQEEEGNLQLGGHEPVLEVSFSTSLKRPRARITCIITTTVAPSLSLHTSHHPSLNTQHSHNQLTHPPTQLPHSHLTCHKGYLRECPSAPRCSGSVPITVAPADCHDLNAFCCRSGCSLAARAIGTKGRCR
eukprot:scaffold72949_cov35-Tisochrysis_lutea.AAC.1